MLVVVLRKKLNERDVHNRTGARFHSSFWPAKLSWLKAEFPDVWKETSQWLSVLRLYFIAAQRRPYNEHLNGIGHWHFRY
jgi:hypothetical protein